MVISTFISGRAGEVESLNLKSSRTLIFSNISVGTGAVLSQCRPEGMILIKNDGMQDLFSFLAVDRNPSFDQLVFNLSTVSVPVSIVQIDGGTMLYRVNSDVHLQTNEDW